MGFSTARLGLKPPGYPAAPDMPADGRFFANDWTITSGDVQLASKEWIKDDPSINATESGTLKLFHRPGE